MKWFMGAALAAMLSAGCAVGWAQNAKPAAEKKEAAKTEGAKQSEAAKRFEQLKTLVGTWKGKAGEGGAPTTFTYRLTGGGSALVETLFLDTPHEMVTVYTVDGDDLVLTHYCAMGNQPHMKAQPGGPANQIRFEFVRGGNMKSEKDGHMHTGVMTFIDADHIKAEWTSYADGKASGTHTIELERVKS